MCVWGGRGVLWSVYVGREGVRVEHVRVCVHVEGVCGKWGVHVDWMCVLEAFIHSKFSISLMFGVCDCVCGCVHVEGVCSEHAC